MQLRACAQVPFLKGLRVSAKEQCHSGLLPNQAPLQVQVKRFMPFLEGNRQCIGMSLAKLNYMTVVALLLSHFRFRLADDVRKAPSLPHCPAVACSAIFVACPALHAMLRPSAAWHGRA